MQEGLRELGFTWCPLSVPVLRTDQLTTSSSPHERPAQESSQAERLLQGGRDPWAGCPHDTHSCWTWRLGLETTVPARAYRPRVQMGGAVQCPGPGGAANVPSSNPALTFLPAREASSPREVRHPQPSPEELSPGRLPLGEPSSGLAQLRAVPARPRARCHAVRLTHPAATGC